MTLSHASAQYSLPDQTQTEAYVADMINDYNALVSHNDLHRPDFDSIKANLSLYESTGLSFKVVVVQLSENATGSVAIVFLPIPADQPQFVFDYNQTLDQFSPTGIGFGSGPFEDMTMKNNLLINGTITNQAFTWVVFKADINASYVDSSLAAAQFIYNQDEASLSKATTSAGATTNITTLITTQSPTSLLDTVKDAFDYIVLGLGAAIATFVGLYWQYRDRRRSGRRRH